MATVTITSSQNLTSVVYAANDDLVISAGVTLTISATPATRIRSITGLFPTSKLLVQNTSTANMLKLSFAPGGFGAVTNGIASLRFENGAEVEFDGDYIQVYTGTGASNQTVLSNLTIGGQAIDIPTFVEVETGSGTGVYEKWMVVPERVTNYEQSQYGYNARYPQTGTVAITSGGVVTLTGGTFVSSQALLYKRFRAAGHATDYLISAYTSTTSITLSNADGTTYTGGAIGAGASYQIRIGSVFERDDFSAGDFGTVLFLDSFGGNALGSAQALKAGDGTYGRVIPSGAKVRVPNIYIGCDLASTTLAAAITGTTAAAITLTSGANFPSTNTPWNNNSSQAGTLLVYDPATGKGERIGYTTIAANVVSATGMTRGAYNSVAQTFPIGATVYFIPHETGTQGNGFLDLQSGGKLVADKVMFGYNFGLCPVNSSVGFVGAKSISVTNSGTILGLSFPNASFVAGDCTFDNVAFTPDMRNPGAGGVYIVNFQGVSGNLTLKNIFVVGSNDFNENGGGQAGHFQVQQCFNISEITNIKSWAVRPTGGGNTQAFLMTGCGATTITNLRVAGGINLLYIGGTIFNQIYTAGNCSTTWVALQPTPCINASTQVLNCIFRGIQNYETAPIASSRTFDFSPTTQGNIVHNKSYPTFNFRNRGGTNNQYVSDTGTRNTFAYFDFINCRDGSTPIATNSQNPGQRLIKITSDQYNATILASAQGPAMAYRGYRDIIFGPQVFSSAFYNLDVNPYTVMTDGTGAGSGGYLCFGPLQPEDTYTNTYTGLGTTAYLNGTGALAITTTGDTVTVKSQYAQKGISSFNTAGSITIIGNTSGTVTAGAFNGVTYEFRMVNWGDDITVPAWQSLTPANLEAARAALSGYSTSVGINMQMRMTATTTVAARTVTLLRMPITWDTAYTPAVGSFNINVTGVLTGSMVAVSTDGGTTWPSAYKKSATGSTVTIPIDCDFLGTTTNLKVRIRKAGYQVLEYDLTTVDEDVNLPIEQVQVVDIDGVAVYGRGSGTTTAYITIVPGSLRVDIGNILVVGEDLYDACAAYQATAAGIAYPEILQFDGTDSIILNTWKLRRDVAGSTNAMIDMIVKYAPNVNTNPVDEVNGSVQLFPRTVRQGSLGAIAATVWDYQTSSATTSGSMGERLKDASTVATNGQQLTAALS